MSTRTSRAVKGTITGIIQNAISIVFQLVITPVILIHAGQQVLGGYAIVMQVISYSLLLDFGFSVALTRYLCQAFGVDHNESRFGELLTVGRNVLIIINLLVFVLLVCTALNVELLVSGSETIQLDTQDALLLMAVWMVVRTPLFIYNTALTATQDMVALNIVAIAVNLLRLLFAVLFTYWGLGLSGLIGANILSEFIGTIVQRTYFHKRYPRFCVPWRRGDTALGKEMLRFGLNYWGVNLAVVLLLGSDNLIAGVLFSATTVSIYYSTKMIGSLVIAFVSRIIDTTYPALNELVGKNDYAAVRSVYLRLLRYVLLLVIPATLGIVLFTEALVTLWVGKKQFAGPIMVACLSVFVFTQILNHLHGIITLALGKLQQWSSVSIASGLLSVALAYSAGKFLGMQWILLGIALAMLPIFIFLFYRVTKQLDVKAPHVIASVKPVILACAPLLAVYWVIDRAIAAPTLTNVGTMLISYFLVWMAGTWVFGLTAGERIQLRGIAVGIMSKIR